jgi:FAD/FMN-containing dehydrogenase
MGLPTSKRSKPVRELGKVAGPNMVSTSPTVCEAYAYSFSLSIDWVTRPDVVVMPRTTAQVSDIVKLANRYKVPITPKGVAGMTGHGGPLQGGILLDLTHMDDILLIDETNMKAVAEPGCSFFRLSQELFKKGMMLPTAEYGCGPNVAASAITPVQGFGKTRYGRNIDLVEGFEVVLPQGEITRIGSMAYMDTDFGPYFRYITGPDLVGLFTQSNGALGIVTKIAYRCLKRPPHWTFFCYYWPLEKIEQCAKAMMEATAYELFDVHINDKWKFEGFRILTGQSLVPDDCYFCVVFGLNAFSQQELEGKRKAVAALCEDLQGKMLPGIAETFFDAWPTFFSPATHPITAQLVDAAYQANKSGYMYMYDSMNYPLSWFPEVYLKILEIAQKHRIHGPPRLTVYDGFPVKSQLMCSQTWAFVNRKDREWMDAIHKSKDELRDWFGKRGGTYQQNFPPLLPEFTWTNQSSAHALLRKLKKVLDPNNILSPGTF